MQEKLEKVTKYICGKKSLNLFLAKAVKYSGHFPRRQRSVFETTYHSSNNNMNRTDMIK